MKTHYPKAKYELMIGTRVTGPDGTTYTRIACRGQADWIDNRGTQYQHLPVTDYAIDYKPKWNDLEAAFKVTPAFTGAGGKGFGVVSHANLQPGDVIMQEGFGLVLSQEITSVEWSTAGRGSSKEDRLIGRTAKGGFVSTHRVNYIARGLGDALNDYVAAS